MIGITRASKQHVKRRFERACDLELRHLRAFVALLDNGSITAAAQALKLAQSTVSEALAALERALGTRVVYRRRGTPESVLTTAGRALLPNARAVLGAVDETYTAIARAAAEARGSVEIVANESISTYLLPKALPGLRSRWPNTRFSVSVATCSVIRQAIKDGACEVGLLLEEAEELSSRATEPRRQFEAPQLVAPLVSLVIFAAPSHPLAGSDRMEPIAKSDLTGFPIFVSDPAGEFHALVSDFFLEDGLPAVRLHSAGSIEGVKKGVIADPCALGILPWYAIVEELRSRRFARLDIRPVPPAMRVVALMSRSQERHPGTVELIAEVRGLLAADGPSKPIARTPLVQQEPIAAAPYRSFR
jgi:DNA-binding transcriptional LysR family regulator